MNDTDSTSNEKWLTAKEAAASLGVKLATLYAYVSRGSIAKKRVAGERASRYSAADIRSLSSRTRSRPTLTTTENPLLTTHLTALADGKLYYRGLDAGELANTWSFERAAEWLWRGETTLGAPDAARPDSRGIAALTASPLPKWDASPEALAICIAAQDALPDGTPSPDRIRQIVATLGPSDAFRYDLSVDAVCSSARTMLATITKALPRLGSPLPAPTLPVSPYGPGDTLQVAADLWCRLTPEPPAAGMIECLNAALVLLADHEMATSTFAARVAASVRADPYSAVIAGLGAVAGRLHGGVGPRAARLLRQISRPADVVPVIAEHLKDETYLPGFGHPLYPEGDPRARHVLALMRTATLGRGQGVRLDTVDRVLDVARSNNPITPNIDFALAALCYVANMAPSASEVVFSVARIAGWIAHALEEYEEPPLRFRVRAEYAGPAP